MRGAVRAAGRWPLAAGRWPLAAGRWPLAAGRWPLAAGRWPLAAGRWPLAAGRWPLAAAIIYMALYAPAAALDNKPSDTRNIAHFPPQTVRAAPGNVPHLFSLADSAPTGENNRSRHTRQRRNHPPHNRTASGWQCLYRENVMHDRENFGHTAVRRRPFDGPALPARAVRHEHAATPAEGRPARTAAAGQCRFRAVPPCPLCCP